MLKKTINYTDYDGNPRTEDHYFNISKAELTDMAMTYPDGLKNTLTSIIKTNDTKRMYLFFKDLILKAYGVKSPDGKRFIKSDEITKEFTQTEAFSVLIDELIDGQLYDDFIYGILPTNGIDKEAAIKEAEKIVGIPIANDAVTPQN